MDLFGPFHFDMEQFFQITPDLVCIAGYDGFFKKINPAVSKTLGYSEEELYSHPIQSFIHPEDKLLTAQKRSLITEGVPLLNFENRYLSKTGEIVWLTWTSTPVKSDRLVFAIAKDITTKKKLAEYSRLMSLLGYASEPKAFRTVMKETQSPTKELVSVLHTDFDANTNLPAYEENWIGLFEKAVRNNLGKTKTLITNVSTELGISERQLHRRVNAILHVTPNQFIQGIRLQVAKEAISSGKAVAKADLARLAGFKTTGYFEKLFKEAFSTDIANLSGAYWLSS